MKKLTKEQVMELRGFKGQKGGPTKFFDYLEEVYKDDEVEMKKIHLCREMRESVDDEEVAKYPNAGRKAEVMFYQWMDDLLEELGYRL